MNLLHRTTRHHRRVITPDGAAVHEPEQSRLSFALFGARSVPEPLVSPSRMLPVHGARVVSLRVPSGPKPGAVGDFVRLGFAAVGRELNQFVAVISSGWRKLAAENDQRMASIDARLAKLIERQHTWAAQEDGRAMEEAYAQGGTELVMKLTPEVLARMDARAKAVAL